MKSPANKSKSRSLAIGREKFSSLVRQHHRELLVYAHALCGDHHGAQDIVQEAFVTAYRLIDVFEPSGDFHAWLRGIVRFKYREWHRKQKRVAKVLSDKEIGVIERVVERWQSVCATEQNPMFVLLDSCLALLPEALRGAVRTFYFEGKDSRDAARVLGVSDVSFRKRLQRAREGILECLNRKSALASSDRNRISEAI